MQFQCDFCEKTYSETHDCNLDLNSKKGDHSENVVETMNSMYSLEKDDNNESAELCSMGIKSHIMKRPQVSQHVSPQECINYNVLI